MVYIDINKQTQAVWFPFQGGCRCCWADVELSAVSTIDLRRVAFHVISARKVGGQICVSVVTPPALVAGEWEYTLTFGHGVKACGVLWVTDEPGQSKQYNSALQIKQYGV